MPLQIAQRFLRNRYMVPEWAVSSFSDLPVQMLQALGWWSFWLQGASKCLQLSLAVWLVPSLSSETILRFQTCSHSLRSQAPRGFLCSPPGVNREQVDVIRCQWFSLVAGLLFNYLSSEWCWVPVLDHLWDIWIIMLHPGWLLTSFEMECFYWIII